MTAGSGPVRETFTQTLAHLARHEAKVPPPGADDLLPLVYEELRRLARAYLRRERSDHTLQPTALVHEAYLRLVDQTRVDWRGRTHFFAIGARMMRRLLVDHAKRQRRAKHGRDWQRVTLIEAARPVLGEILGAEELLALDRALQGLKAVDERQAAIVELRFFAGLQVEEVADYLGISRRTVERDWTHARAWLKRELASRSPAR